MTAKATKSAFTQKNQKIPLIYGAFFAILTKVKKSKKNFKKGVDKTSLLWYNIKDVEVSDSRSTKYAGVAQWQSS